MNEARNVTRDKGSDTWFPTSREAESTAKAVCVACPVRRDCLSYALASPDLVGIWAGTDEAPQSSEMNERKVFGSAVWLGSIVATEITGSRRTAPGSSRCRPRRRPWNPSTVEPRT